jgi:hypothetical protein
MMNSQKVLNTSSPLMGELSPSGGGRGRIEVMVILVKYQQVVFHHPTRGGEIRLFTIPSKKLFTAIFLACAG